MRLERPSCDETLLAAAFWLLLDASKFGKTFWTGGDHGDLVRAQEILVAVGDVDRRVLRIRVVGEVSKLGLFTCVRG